MKSLLPLVLGLFLAQSAHAVCTAAFTYDTQGQAVHFTDISTSTSGPIVSWFWNFDDGTTSNQQNPIHTFPDPDDHYDVTLTITTADGCTSTIEVEDVEVCDLIVNVNVGTCGSNFQVPLNITVSDPLDNAVEIEITVDGVLIPGGPFDIDDDDPVSLTHLIEGDGDQHIITATSTETGGCIGTVTVTVPNCGGGGPTCFLTNLDVNFQGGTTHNVQVGPSGNNSFSPQQVTITVGDVVHFVWLDGGHTTTSDATSGPDSWNSGEHSTGFTYDVNLVNPGLHRYYCQPHGGPGGSGMAGSIVANCPSGNNFTLLVTFNTTQANAAGYHLLIDDVVVGGVRQYNGTGPQSTTVPMPGDGQPHNIKIRDVADPTCFIMTSLQAPNCGAAPACNLSLTATQNGGCNAANQVPYSVAVTDINGGTSFTINVDGVAAGTFPYNPSGTTTVTINVPLRRPTYKRRAVPARRT
jgi:plastocyanin